MDKRACTGGLALFLKCAVFCLFTSTNPLHSQWVQTQGPYGGDIRAFALYGTNFFAGSYGGGVFVSSNNGTSWTPINTGLTSPYVNALAVYINGTGGTNLSAATNGGVFLSTNGGIAWNAVNTGLTNTDVRALAVSPVGGGTSGANFFAGTSGGVFLSTNNGTSWGAVNTGLTDTSVFALSVWGSSLFSGTDGSGVFRRLLSEMITGLEDNNNQIPTRFALEQNYPNPFNPTTTIRYGLPARLQITLTVYNSLGQQVAMLASGEQDAGFHEVRFNADKLASGMYFYRLAAGEFVQTRKVALVR